MGELQGLSKRVTTLTIVMSILMIVFGFVALAMPVLASIGVAIFVGWLMLFDGGAQLIHAFQSKGVGHIAWKLLVALIYLVAGIYLVAHPVLGVASLTLILAIFFFAEGIVDVVAYFSTRKVGGSGWMLLDGVVTIILGFLIWRQWPSSSLWAIGTLLGISMLMTGTARLMMALAVRRVVKNVAGAVAGRAA